jgi:hypothetical protein
MQTDVLFYFFVLRNYIINYFDSFERGCKIRNALVCGCHELQAAGNFKWYRNGVFERGGY